MCRNEATRITLQWVRVCRIYLAYLFVYAISFKSIQVYFDHKEERGLPFWHSVTQSSTISCNCFSTSSMGWQASTTCIKPVEKEGRTKKKRKRFNMQPNLAWRPKCCKILKWQQARHLEIIETKKYYHFARLIAIITKYEYQKRTVNFRRKGQKNSPLPSRKHHEELYNFQQLSSEIPAFHISHHHTLLFLQLSDMNMQGISISKIGESE